MTYPDGITVGRVDHRRFLYHGTQCKNSYLRLDDNRRSHDVAERPDVGNSKRTSGEIVGLEFIVTCTACQIVHRFCEAPQTVLVNVANNGYNEVARGKCHCHSDVDLFLADDTIAIDLDIHHRIILQGKHYCFNEDWCKGESVTLLFLEFRLPAVAPI